MAEMAVQGLLEFWPCKSVNNPNFGLPIKTYDAIKAYNAWKVVKAYKVNKTIKAIKATIKALKGSIGALAKSPKIIELLLRKYT